jgi:hypothetical protein
VKIIITIFIINIFSLSYAQTDTRISKKNYTLFNPTPKNLMREFATDKPDATESPYTIDAGHFQLETDLFKSERLESRGTKTISNFYGIANIKMGITNSLDMQLVVSPLEVLTINNGIFKMKTSQFGGLTLRAKQNLWGNDGGQFALSVLPFVTIPTQNGDKFSGGIVIPFAVSFNGWGLGAQAEADASKSESANMYYVSFLASATLSHSLLENFDFFIEAVLSKDNELKRYEYFLNGGFVFAVAPSIHIDTGIYYGIKSVSATTYFLGLSFRL